MQFISVDEYEFDSPSSEETLLLAIATDQQFDDWNEFLEATLELGFDSQALPEWEALRPLMSLKEADQVMDYVSRFSPVILSEQAQVVVLFDEWQEQDFFIEEDGTLLRFAWQSSAQE
ncbi:hypothetical protein VST7929_01576 [Vibrio stylophorae]|uniref:Uncharacterized protein n=1 Tax=Vibrio stylophorae TaxID=659351 RepID=A0ABN8DRC3_9VIBR|nr:hypothetical protein [Vibrio stylophorae]CAH0533701.1 hypothetical protein VST7929_01576 [Vibrio stylophorae]